MTGADLEWQRWVQTQPTVGSSMLYENALARLSLCHQFHTIGTPQEKSACFVCMNYALDVKSV